MSASSTSASTSTSPADAAVAALASLPLASTSVEQRQQQAKDECGAFVSRWYEAQCDTQPSMMCSYFKHIALLCAAEVACPAEFDEYNECRAQVDKERTYKGQIHCIPQNRLLYRCAKPLLFPTAAATVASTEHTEGGDASSASSASSSSSSSSS